MSTDARITRRRLIGTAAAGAAAAALPVTPVSARSRRKADVVIVGAGLAGLTAARDLAKHHRSVIVLEARDRVGGRTLNHPLGDGQAVEVGGEFVGPTQDRVLALARSLGVGTFKAYNEGQDVVIARGRRSLYPAVPGLPDDSQDQQLFDDIVAALNDIDKQSAKVGVRAPWKAPGAAALDARTLESWSTGLFKSPLTQPLFEAASQALWGKDTGDLSYLYSLFYSASAGDAKHPGLFARLLSVSGGAQESRFTGGSQRIALRVAKALGERVVLRSPVHRISQTRSGVTVVSDKLTVDAKLAIVAVPPTLAHSIRFSPALPSKHAQLLRNYLPGTMIKAQLVYDRPWWRDKGLTAQIVCDPTGGPAGITYDNTPESGVPGVVLGFIGGSQAVLHRKRTKEQRRQVFIDELAAALGEEARSAVDWFEMDWSSEKWTKGCPTGTMAPHVMTRFGSAMRQPAGRIHFAGTETSDFWAGYMDGAVRSGERVAKETLRVL